MRKILIVDDQPEVRELVRVTLEIGNYLTLSAENGQQALELARTEHPDIILLDLKMPGSRIQGLEVCRRLKNDPTTAGIYVIKISDNTGSGCESNPGQDLGNPPGERRCGAQDLG